jgi:hypothetical protein
MRKRHTLIPSILIASAAVVGLTACNSQVTTQDGSTSTSSEQDSGMDTGTGMGMTYGGKMGMDLGGGLVLPYDGSGISMGYGF